MKRSSKTSFIFFLYSPTHVNKNKHVCLPAPERTLNENISWGVAWYEITDLEVKYDITCNIILKVVSATFLANLFCMPKRQHLWNKEKYFLFHFESSFCSRDNQILTFQVFKCHEVIKCLGMKHKTYIDE